MKRNAILRNYHTMTILEKIAFGRHVITSEAAAVVNFPTPLPTLADKTTITDALEVAYNDAMNGDRDKIRIMHEREAEWIKIFDDNADYVEDIAKGDVEILLSSGHAVTKVAFDKHAKPDQMLVNAVAKTGTHGALEISTKTLTNSDGILGIAAFVSESEVFTITQIGDRQLDVTVGNHKITFLLMTKHKGELTGLPQFQLPKIYMLGFNAAGAGPLSNVVSDVIVP